jgi:hypothetical protein
VVVSVGLVLGAEKLKPISWRDWAGEIERDGGARNPYLSLEERYGFWDIRVSFPPTAVNKRPWIAFNGTLKRSTGANLGNPGQTEGVCGLDAGPGCVG